MTTPLDIIRKDYTEKLSVLVKKLLKLPDWTQLEGAGYISPYGRCGKHIAIKGDMSFKDIKTMHEYSKIYWGCNEEYYGITITKSGNLCLILSTIDTDFLVTSDDVSVKTLVEIYNKLKNHENL